MNKWEVRAILFIWLGTVNAQIEFEEVGGGIDHPGFVVKVNGFSLLKHSPPEHSLFSLGLGNFDAKEKVGNWQLNDTILNEYHLDRWQLRKVLCYL